MLVEHARAPFEHVDAVAAVDVRHAPRRAERVLLRAERQRAQRLQGEQIAEYGAEPVVRSFDAARPRREAPAHERAPGILGARRAKGVDAIAVMGQQHAIHHSVDVVEAR